MTRLVPTREIKELWDAFFVSTDPFFKTQRDQVVAAVAGSTAAVFLRHTPEPNQRLERTNQLMEVGRFFAGSALKFGQMFDDEITTLNFETENRSLYVIAFRTESPDERQRDAVVVLYGIHLDFMAFQFNELTRVPWDELKKRLKL